MASYVYATFSTWVTPTVAINRGEVWDASDPVVKAHPDWFTDDPRSILRRSGPDQGEDVEDGKAESKGRGSAGRTTSGKVEQATAAPGEKRSGRSG